MKHDRMTHDRGVIFRTIDWSKRGVVANSAELMSKYAEEKLMFQDRYTLFSTGTENTASKVLPKKIEPRIL